MNDREMMDRENETEYTWELGKLTWVKGGLACDIRTHALRTATPQDLFALDAGGLSGDERPKSNIEEWIVNNPLDIFRELAKAGESYILRWVPTPNGACIKAIGEDDDKLMWFCQKYGLPAEADDMSVPLWMPNYQLYPLPELLSYDHQMFGSPVSLKGRADKGLRTTAALAYLCQRLADLLDKKKWYDLQKLANEIYPGTFTFGPATSAMGLVWTIDNDSPVNVNMRRAAVMTMLEIAGWYINDSLRVTVRPPTIETPVPRLIQATNGLRSYLWLHFAMSRRFQSVKHTVRRTCRRDGTYHGCGRTFDTDNPRARLCDECKRRKMQEKNVRKYNKRKERKQQA